MGGALFLGTNIQPKLGFVLVVETAEKLVDLLTGEECRGEELLNQDSHVQGEEPLNQDPQMPEEEMPNQDSKMRGGDTSGGDVPLLNHMSPQHHDICQQKSIELTTFCPHAAMLSPSSAEGEDTLSTVGVLPRGEELCANKPADSSRLKITSCPDTERGVTTTDDTQVGVVQLLKTIPAGHKMIRARIH